MNERTSERANKRTPDQHQADKSPSRRLRFHPAPAISSALRYDISTVSCLSRDEYTGTLPRIGWWRGGESFMEIPPAIPFSAEWKLLKPNKALHNSHRTEWFIIDSFATTPFGVYWNKNKSIRVQKDLVRRNMLHAVDLLVSPKSLVTRPNIKSLWTLITRLLPDSRRMTGLRLLVANWFIMKIYLN